MIAAFFRKSGDRFVALAMVSLAAAWPALNVALAYPQFEVSWHAVSVVALVTGIGLATLVGLAGRLVPSIGSPAWAGFFSAALLLVLSWSGATAFLKQLGVDDFRGAIWLAGFSILLVAVFCLARRRDGRHAILAAEIVLFGLLAWPIYATSPHSDPGPDLAAKAIPALAPSAGRPSVFLFVLDSYERSDVLARDFGWDNGPFIDRLEDRGFVVADRARSTDHGSIRTVSRTFLHPALYDSELQRISRPPVLSGDNPVVRWFRGAGYSFVLAPGSVEPGEAMRCIGLEDVCLVEAPSGAVRLISILARLTPFWNVMRHFGVYPGGVKSLSDVVGRFERRLDEIQPPVFFFTHLQALHQPYHPPEGCVDAVRIRDRQVNSAPKAVYRSVLRCLNLEMQKAIDLLLDRFPDAVVIVMGDHGSRIGILGHPGQPPATEEESDARRYAVLLALRLPPRCREGVDPAMTTGDIFPVVLQCLTGGNGK